MNPVLAFFVWSFFHVSAATLTTEVAISVGDPPAQYVRGTATELIGYNSYFVPFRNLKVSGRQPWNSLDNFSEWREKNDNNKIWAATFDDEEMVPAFNTTTDKKWREMELLNHSDTVGFMCKEITTSKPVSSTPTTNPGSPGDGKQKLTRSGELENGIRTSGSGISPNPPMSSTFNSNPESPREVGNEKTSLYKKLTRSWNHENSSKSSGLGVFPDPAISTTSNPESPLAGKNDTPRGRPMLTGSGKVETILKTSATGTTQR